MIPGVSLSPAGWLAAWGVAYSLLHHLGALPGGLGSAGGATRWVDWIDLAVPYLVVGPALAALAASAADRRSWLIGLTGAAAYVSGHGIHLAANSIGNQRGDAAPVHLWDEVVGHAIWYAGVALLVIALARAVQLERIARPAGCWPRVSVRPGRRTPTARTASPCRCWRWHSASPRGAFGPAPPGPGDWCS